MTFAEAIEDETNGEPILAVFIAGGRTAWNGGAYWSKEKDPARTVPPGSLDIALSWSVARPLLNYRYNDGFGSQDCHDIIAWTESRVLLIHEYEGSTSVIWVPRNPPATQMAERTSVAV